MIIYIDGVYGTSITVTLLLNGARDAVLGPNDVVWASVFFILFFFACYY